MVATILSVGRLDAVDNITSLLYKVTV